MYDWDTPSLNPVQIQGGHRHLVPPQSAGDSSETSSSGVSHRTVQSVEQQMLQGRQISKGICINMEPFLLQCSYLRSKHKQCWINTKESGTRKEKSWIRRKKRSKIKLVHWREPLKRSGKSRRLSGRNVPKSSESDRISRGDTTHATKEDHRGILRKVEDMTKGNAL